MILPDVNILIYAFRSEAPEHTSHADWLEETLRSNRPFAVSSQAMCSLVRILTNSKLFRGTYPLGDLLQFCNALKSRPNCRVIQPGPSHWEIFVDLCRRSNAHGAVVQDAWFAALAIEHDCEWITHDHDYARFPGLRWRPPF